MRAAIYCRVSDDKLKEDGERRQDIERQVARLTPYVSGFLASPEGVGWDKDFDVFRDDGRSAFKDDYQSRPDFVRLLREIRAHRVQRVWVEDLTRWSRRIEDGLRTLKEVTACGATITSTAEGECDITRPEGWFKVGVAFLIAEWSSRSQSYKVKQAMERRRESKDQICASCGVVHLGRHPAVCGCKRCLKKRGGQTL